MTTMPDPPIDDSHALGGDTPDDGQEAASFARLAALHRSLQAEDLEQLPPPPEVWERISASLTESTAAEAAVIESTPAEAKPARPAPTPTAPDAAPAAHAVARSRRRAGR